MQCSGAWRKGSWLMNGKTEEHFWWICNIWDGFWYLEISTEVILGRGNRMKMQRGISFSSWRCRRIQRPGKSFIVSLTMSKSCTDSKLTTILEPMEVLRVQGAEHRESEATAGRDETQSPTCSGNKLLDTGKKSSAGVTGELVKAGWVCTGESEWGPWGMQKWGEGSSPCWKFFLHESHQSIIENIDKVQRKSSCWQHWGRKQKLLWEEQGNLPKFSCVFPTEQHLYFGRGATNTIILSVLVQSHCSWGKKTGKKISTPGKEARLQAGFRTMDSGEDRIIEGLAGSLSRPSPQDSEIQ